jgi:pimeloyl-ACP methyl ester carboxylesterase
MHYSSNKPVRLVGHSMGAAIASTYAAVKPERVSKLVMIDFLGIKPAKDANPTDQLSKWLKDFEDVPRLRLYKSAEALAARLKSVNARLTDERADFLARYVGKSMPDGQVAMACDPWHKTPSPFIYRMDDSQSIWGRIKAPTLMLMAEGGYVRMRYTDDEAQYRTSLGCFENLQAASILNSGHNVQHDQPEVLAQLIEHFMTQTL